MEEKEEMIKVDYEGAWEELYKEWGFYSPFNLSKKVTICIASIMKDIEQKHTQVIIGSKRNIDEEMLNYYMKKFTEIHLENINLREKLKKLNNRPIKPERMDYMEKGAAIGKPRIFNKRKYEEKMDKWFNDLSDSQKVDIAYNFWDSASYEDKKEEYELE